MSEEQAQETGKFQEEHQTIQDALALIDDSGPSNGDGVVVEQEAEGQPEDIAESDAETDDHEKGEKSVEQEAEEQEKPTARGWAAIAAREKKLREREQELKSQQHELNTMRQEIENLKETQKVSEKDLKADFAKDPFGTFQKTFGVSYEQFIDMGLQDNPKPPQTAGSEELSELKGMIQNLQTQLQQKETQSAYAEYVGKVRQELASEDFTLLNTMPNAEREVLDYIEGYAKQYGEVLQPRDAVARIHAEWVEKIRTLRSHAKARQLLGLEETEEKTDDAPSKSQASTKTLKNKDQRAPPKGQGLPDNLTEQEELLEALKLVR